MNPGVFSITALLLCVCPAFSVRAWAADSTKFDPQVVKRGHAEFKSSCGFCHGEDAAGNRAPDLIRSTILNHDQGGDLLKPVIHNGRPDKGMPAFADLPDTQVADMIVFLHSQAYTALHSASVPGDYPLAKLLTGNAEHGKAFFNGAGGCSGCHSVTGDLAGIAQKYRPIDLQQNFVYPKSDAGRTATVTTADGAVFEGAVNHSDEFTIAIVTKDGEYRSWPRDRVQVKITDPLQAHRELTARYTDTNIHDLFAYLETLKR